MPRKKCLCPVAFGGHWEKRDKTKPCDLCGGWHPTALSDPTTAKYVLLRRRTNDGLPPPGFITTNLSGGEWLGYEVLGYASTIAEAQTKLFGRSYTDSKD